MSPRAWRRSLAGKPRLQAKETESVPCDTRVVAGIWAQATAAAQEQAAKEVAAARVAATAVRAMTQRIGRCAEAIRIWGAYRKGCRRKFSEWATRRASAAPIGSTLAVIARAAAPGGPFIYSPWLDPMIGAPPPSQGSHCTRGPSAGGASPASHQPPPIAFPSESLAAGLLF